MKTDKLLLLGGVGIGVYLLARIFGLVGMAGRGLATVGEAVSSGLFDFFNPNAAGETVFYTVRFSDGWHAVPSASVALDGSFTWTDGKRYRIMIQKLADTNRNKVAVAL